MNKSIFTPFQVTTQIRIQAPIIYMLWLEYEVPFCSVICVGDVNSLCIDDEETEIVWIN